MPPDSPIPSPDRPSAWLARAAGDLRLAAVEVEGVFREDLCYHAHQCAEKSLKAVLLSLAVAVPRTHSLVWLMDLIQKNGIPVPETVKDAAVLDEYSVESRYPGFDEPITEEERRQALDRAQAVLDWASATV